MTRIWTLLGTAARYILINTTRAGTCDETTAGRAAFAGGDHRVKIKRTKSLQVEISVTVDTCSMWPVSWLNSGEPLTSQLLGRVRFQTLLRYFRPRQAQHCLLVSWREARTTQRDVCTPQPWLSHSAEGWLVFRDARHPFTRMRTPIRFPTYRVYEEKNIIWGQVTKMLRDCILHRHRHGQARW